LSSYYYHYYYYHYYHYYYYYYYYYYYCYYPHTGKSRLESLSVLACAAVMIFASFEVVQCK
jgi:hypothetical protein